MKIAIRILTYQRKDGKSEEYLRRSLGSIKRQTHQDYKVFLIGDKYDNHEELMRLSNIINSEKIYVENLPIAVEREKYPAKDIRLWCAGGTNASNHSISKIKEHGYTWTCNLDHDDWWERDHLENINNLIENNPEKYVFIASKSTYVNNQILPKTVNGNIFYPLAGDIIHSSVCVDWSKIPLKFRDVYEEEGRYHAGDADMWQRMTIYMQKNNLMGCLIDKTTCHHDEERSG